MEDGRRGKKYLECLGAFGKNEKQCKIGVVMDKKQKSLLIFENISIRDAMRQMSQVGERVLFVVNQKNQLLGSISAGDTRRWILANGSLKEKIEKAYNKNPIFVEKGFNPDTVKQIMLKEKIEGIPVVDSNRVVIEVLFWMNVFGREISIPKGKINIPVVIMAGGKGTRLDPFTKVLPKPLIPIADKTIIEIIMDKFVQYGVKELYLSINHKSRMIKAYFEEVPSHYKIRYLEENKPLGTAGSLRLLKDISGDSLLVSNCDIIIESDYHEIVEFHKAKENDITVVGSFRHFTIPYGICYIQNGGNLIDIQEKPEYDYLVNTGMYVLQKEVLRHIPKNKIFNMTDLIKCVKSENGKVGVFPIDEKSWIDIGEWEEYRRAIRLFDR